MLRAIHRCLLRLYPSNIRREIGDEMEEVFLHCVAIERSRHPRAGALFAVGRGALDALTFAIASRQHQRSMGTHPLFTWRRLMPFNRHDFTSAVRRMRQQPLSALAIVLMLALGIGASTAMFSVIHGVLLAPLPFPEADRIVQIWGTRTDRGWDQMALTEADFWDIRDLTDTFEHIGGWHLATVILVDADAPEQVQAALVSSGFFRALGVQPIAGRLFDAEDDVPGAPRRVLLSHALWARRYGSDPSIVGKSITFAIGTRVVIGVLPPGTPWLDAAELFVPLQRRTDANRTSYEYVAIGRLKPGVSIDTGRASLQAVIAELVRRHPTTNTGLGGALVPSSEWIASETLRRTLWILLGAVGLLLVIACVNVINLLLARGAARLRESAVRTALGAGRGALLRESLVEALLLSAVATAAGLLVAWGLLALMRGFDPGQIPRLATATLNGWVFLFASLVAVAVGFLTGLIPALQAPLANIVTVLRSGQRGAAGDRRHHRLRGVFVAAEVALSLMLLVGAGLLVRSFTQVLTVDRGFQTHNRLFASVTIPASVGAARIGQISRDVMTRLEALPDVISVAAVSSRPVADGSTGLGLAAADNPSAPDAAVPWGTWRVISPAYFKAIGLPLLKGRSFDESDEIGKPWRVVISERVANMFWPGENPIGRTLILWRGQTELPGEVIGVVGDMRERGLDSDPTLAVYFPAGSGGSRLLQLVLHTRRDPALVVPALRTVIREVERSMPISNIRTFDEEVTRSVATRRFTVALLAGFAGLALLLALAGVYGVLAYVITRRTPEIGIRVALGARHHRVLRLVVAQGMRPVIAGVLAGLLASWWLSQLMAGLLFGITPRDPLTFVAVTMALIAVAVVACYLPARRVLRVDPVVALRAE